MPKTLNSPEHEEEFDLMALGIKCPNCRSGAKKEVYRSLGPHTFLMRCLNCEHAWRVKKIFRFVKEEELK